MGRTGSFSVSTATSPCTSVLGTASSSPYGGDGSLSEVVFLVECSVEAVPALWQTRGREGFVLLAEEDASIHPGDEVRAGSSGDRRL